MRTFSRVMSPKIRTASPGPGKGWRVMRCFWHAQLTAYAAHFIFEQKAERFAKFQIHLFGQTAYIVMAFNHRTCDRQGFDAVGVNGTLCQPLHVFNLVSFFIEYVDKSFADDFTFAFRFGYACQFGKELFAGVYRR